MIRTKGMVTTSSEHGNITISLLDSGRHLVELVAPVQGTFRRHERHVVSTMVDARKVAVLLAAGRTIRFGDFN